MRNQSIDLDQTNESGYQNTVELDELSTRVFRQLQTIYNQTIKPHQSPWYVDLSKGVCYLLSVNAGVPYIIPAYQFASNPYLGVAYGISIYVALGSVSVWSVRNFFDYIGLIRSNPKTNRAPELVITLSSIILGVGSAVPGALITLRYNSPWMLPFSLFLDISTNSASFNILFRQIYNDIIRYRKLPHLREQRDLILAFLEYGVHKSAFSETPLTLENLEPIIMEFYNAGVQFLPTYRIRQAHPKIFFYGLHSSSKVLGFLLPLSWEVVTTYLTYEGMIKNFSIPRFFSGLIGLITTLPTYFLEFLFSTTLVSTIYTFITNKLYGINNLNPAFINHPKTTLVFLFIAYAFTILAFSGRSKVVIDLFSDPTLQHAILGWVISGAIISKFFAITGNVIDIQNRFMALRLNGNDYIRQALFEKYRIVLNTLPPAYVQAFIQNLTAKNVIEAQEIDEQADTQNDLAMINNPFTLLAHRPKREKKSCCSQLLSCTIL